MAFNPYANYGYAAITKQSNENAIKPTIYVKIISESLMPTFNRQGINEIAGSRARDIRSIQGSIEMGGEIEFFVDDKVIGHFLTSFFGLPTTQTASTGIYRHQFNLQKNDAIYTIDINPADAPWVHRFISVHINGLSFSKEDNAIKVTAQCMPTKAFVTSLVTEAIASTGTTLKLKQTTGLTTADSIIVIDKDDGVTELGTRTISSITNETQLEVGSAFDFQVDVDDIIVIKRATITEADYSQCEPFQFSNGTGIFTGKDIDNVVADDKEDLTMEFANEIEPKTVSGLNEVSRYPAKMFLKGQTANLNVTKFYSNQSNISKLQDNTKIAMRVLMQKRNAITANSAQKASSTFGTTNGFKVEASTAGKAGNDLNITIVLNTTDDLAASKSGNNILLKLANATASKNTGTLIAAALDALTGVDATAQGDGTEQFTTASANVNLGNKGTGTDVVGLDASTVPYLEFNFADVRLDPFFPNMSEDEIVMEEIPMVSYIDSSCRNDQKKNWGARVFLVNSVASY